MATPFETIWCVKCHEELGDGEKIGTANYRYKCDKCGLMFVMMYGKYIYCLKHGQMSVVKGKFPSMTDRYSCICGDVDVVWD